MSSGERPIGATKGKQSNTEALCQPPPVQGGVKQEDPSEVRSNTQKNGWRTHWRRAITTGHNVPHTIKTDPHAHIAAEKCRYDRKWGR